MWANAVRKEKDAAATCAGGLQEDGPVLTSGKADFWHQGFRLRKDGKGAWGVLLVEGGAKSDKELANSVLIGLRMSDSNKTPPTHPTFHSQGIQGASGSTGQLRVCFMHFKLFHSQGTRTTLGLTCHVGFPTY